jgi:hypothetical protein
MYDTNMSHISHQHAFRVVQQRSSFFWDTAFHHWVFVAHNSETTHAATEHTTQENEDLNNFLSLISSVCDGMDQSSLQGITILLCIDVAHLVKKTSNSKYRVCVMEFSCKGHLNLALTKNVNII